MDALLLLLEDSSRSASLFVCWCCYCFVFTLICNQRVCCKPPNVFPSPLNALFYPKMTSRHCFPTTSLIVGKKIPSTFPGGWVVVQKWENGYGGGATHPLQKKNKQTKQTKNKNKKTKNVCHRPSENRMSLGFLWPKTNFALF